MKNILSGLALGLCCVAASGCGKSSGLGDQPPREQAALRDVAEMYRVYTLTNQKPPRSIADLAPLANVGSFGFTKLKAGQVVVRYGATMSDTETGPAATSSDEVLGYEKAVPEQGGEVLMLDRTVRKMSADEFKAAKKAGKD